MHAHKARDPGFNSSSDNNFSLEILTVNLLQVLYLFQHKNITLYKQVNHQIHEEINQIYIWSITLYGLEIWTLRKLEQKYLESFKM